MNVTVSKIATGVPIGTDMEYIDSLTLEMAIDERKDISWLFFILFSGDMMIKKLFFLIKKIVVAAILIYTYDYSIFDLIK